MRIPFLCTTAVAVIGCGAPTPDVAVGVDDHALLGAVSYASDCTANDKTFLAKTMHYGRTIATTPAYQQCVDKAVRTGFTRSGSSWIVGPYMACNGDPYQTSDVATQISRALTAERSSVDVKITCTGARADANAVAGID